MLTCIWMVEFVLFGSFIDSKRGVFKHGFETVILQNTWQHLALLVAGLSWSCFICCLLLQCLRSHLLVDLHPAQRLALDTVISVVGVCDSVISVASVHESCVLCCLL